MLLFRCLTAIIVATTCIAQPAELVAAPKPSSLSSWQTIEKNTHNGIVQISVITKEFNWFNPYISLQSKSFYGSGFFISADGYIVTCAHVLSQAIAVFISLPEFGKRRFKAEVISLCPQDDIALLKISEESLAIIREKCGSIPHLTLGNSNSAQRSDEIFVLGYPGTREFETIKGTVGIISAHLGSFLQYDAAVNPGNSGGPVFNANGEVIGICDSRDSRAQNISFCIPINTLKARYNDLLRNKILRITDIGLIWSYTTPEIKSYLKCPANVDGLIVCDAEPLKQAYKAGIRSGDIISSIDTYAVDNFGDIDLLANGEKISFHNYITQLPLGTIITFTIYRNGKKFVYQLSMIDQSEESIPTRYIPFESVDYEVVGGLIIMPLTFNFIKRVYDQRPALQRYLAYMYDNGPRLVVANTIPESKVAQMRTIRWADTISEVNGEKVQTLADFRKALLKSSNSGIIVFRTTDESSLNTDNILTVLSVKETCEETAYLSEIHNFPLSETMQQMTDACLAKNR